MPDQPPVSLKKCFGLHEGVMKIVGLRPFDNYPWLYPIHAWGLYFFFIFPLPILVFYHYLNATSEETVGVFSSVFLVLEIFVSCVKLFPFKSNPQLFINNMNVWKNGVDETYSELDADILKQGERLHIRVFKTFVYTVSAAWIVLILQQVLAPGRGLPSDVVMPFDALSNTVIYYGVSIYLHLTTLHTSLTNLSVDTLLPALLYHSAMQIKIVKKRLQYMESYIKDDLDKVSGLLTEYELKVYTDKLIHEKIRNCTDLTEKVIKCVKDTEELFSTPVLALIISQAIIIASVLLNIWNYPVSSFHTVSSVIFLVATLPQIFFACYSGTTLLDESETLPTAIYFSNWIEYNAKNKRALTIMAERFKKPITVIAGKILPLELETFGLIMKRSYTVLTLLKNFSQK